MIQMILSTKRTLTDLENKLTVARGKDRDKRDSWEFEINMYTHCYILNG